MLGELLVKLTLVMAVAVEVEHIGMLEVLLGLDFTMDLLLNLGLDRGTCTSRLMGKPRYMDGLDLKLGPMMSEWLMGRGRDQQCD